MAKKFRGHGNGYNDTISYSYKKKINPLLPPGKPIYKYKVKRVGMNSINAPVPKEESYIVIVYEWELLPDDIILEKRKIEV